MSLVVADHAPLLERAFEFTSREGAYEIEEIDGEVPSYLDGTYYLNGPARFRRGEVRYNNWLDGDGMVCRLRLRGGRAWFRSRFVGSTKHVAEEEAGRAIFRTFGTSFEGDELIRGIALASPVNVSVYPFAGTLLAFGEQGLPWELDPETLETRGEYTFGGRLNAISPFSAHPYIDLDSGELLNFGVSFSARQPMVQLFRFDRDGGLIYRQRLPLKAPCSIHDFAVAERHIIVYVNPYVLDMAGLMASGQTLLDTLEWQPHRGTELLIADRETGEKICDVALGDAYCLHQIHSFEEDGDLVLDVVELDQPVYDQYAVPELFPEARTSELVRYRIDLERRQVVARRTLPYRKMCDFPAVDPRLAGCDYQDFWVLGISATEKSGRKFFDQLVRANWQQEAVEIYQAPAGHYLGGEPIFLPDMSDDRRGAVICQCFDAERQTSAFLLFDAHDVAAGPIATLRLRDPLFLGFHTSYAWDQAA